MGKKKNPLVLVILVGILLISFFYLVNFNKDEGSGMIIHYYKDGVEVFQSNLLSVIQVDTSSYDEISFEIIGENLGNYQIINMQVDNAGPIQFKDSLPTLSKSLAIGETRTLWISDRIEIHQFEALPQPVKFWVNISGESPYIQGKIYDYMELEMEFFDEEEYHWDTEIDGNTNPYGITTDGNNIWITDVMKFKVFKYDMNGNYISKWDTRYEYPNGITTDGNNIWIMNEFYDLVEMYDMNGNYIKFSEWSTLHTEADSSASLGITTDGINLWTVDYVKRKVYKWEINGPPLIDSWDVGLSGTPIRITTDGINIWVLEGNYYGVDEVNKYDMDGNYINTLILSTTNQDAFGIATDGINLWIVDKTEMEVYKYKNN